MRQSLEALARQVDAAALPPEARVLEIGCGAGNLTVSLARRGFRVSGVDIAPSAIEWARERAAREGVDLDLRVGSVVDLADFADGQFDAVVDGHCLHCIIGEDRGRCLRSVHRVLRPGGAFLVDTMILCDMTRALEGYDPATNLLIAGDLATRFLGTPESIEGEIRDAGFRIEESILDPGEGFYVRARKPGEPVTRGIP